MRRSRDRPDAAAEVAGGRGAAQLSEKRGPWDMVVVGWSHAGIHAYVAGLGILIPFVIAAFHTNYAVIGILLSATYIIGSGLQLLALILKRTSARLLLTIQNLACAVAAAINAWAPGLAVFVAGRFLQAAASWPQHPVGSSYLASRYPGRGMVLSWHVTAGNLGTLLAPFAVSAAVATWGWRAGFLVLSVILLSATLLVALTLKAPWRSLAPSSLEEGEARTSFRELLRKREVLALLVAGMIAAGGQGVGMVGVYTPGYLHSGLHMTEFPVASVLTVLYIGAVAGPLIMGWVADRTAHVPVLLVNYALGAVALGSFVLVGRSIWYLAAVGLAVGIFSYSELPLRQTVFADFLPEGMRRAGFGIFFTISQSIGAIWVAVIGVAVTTVGFQAAFGIMAGTFLAGMLVVIWGTRGGARRERAAT